MGTGPGGKWRRYCARRGTRSSRLAADEALPPGVDRGLGAVLQVELAQHVADVPLDRLLADRQFRGDLPVGAPLRDQAQHLLLPLGQVGVGIDLRPPLAAELL